MLFNSLSFIIFFPVVTILYFLARPPSESSTGSRWIVLLVASCIFYMWFIPQYILVLALTIVVDYWAGLLIYRSEGRRRKFFLVTSVIVTCLILFFFKYFNFFNLNFKIVAEKFGLHYPIEMINLILPIGLSFHTFQSLSYVIEVYRGNQKPEQHFGIYSLYVMFYPQLVAGPIERPQNLLWQFRQHFRFDYQRVADGLKLMAWGLFKKVVIADRLAVYVNQAYGDPAQINGLGHIVAAIFFAFQIYCDFSGYSDVAIGSAQVMGFNLMDNFKRPYFSKTISEFWKRWHISLSTWFRDYLYISLGGNKCSRARWQFNLFFTFLLSGLWHGANWTYIAWGAINGFYLIFAIWTAEVRNKFYSFLRVNTQGRLFKAFSVSITFILICFSWIFFRAKSIEDALLIVSSLPTALTPAKYLFQSPINPTLLFGNGTDLNVRWFIISIGLIVGLLFVHLAQRHYRMRSLLRGQPFFIRWAFYYGILILIIFIGVYGENQFIYFQF